ncbi:hypothetical protein STEG23_007645 [Scotinomys teguina]
MRGIDTKAPVRMLGEVFKGPPGAGAQDPVTGISALALSVPETSHVSIGLAAGPTHPTSAASIGYHFIQMTVSFAMKKILVRMLISKLYTEVKRIRGPCGRGIRKTLRASEDGA